MRRTAPSLRALALPLLLSAGCDSTGTSTMNTMPDMALNLPPLFLASDKTMAKKANMACNGKFMDPVMPTTMDTEVNGTIKDFQDDNLVEGAVVTLYSTPQQVIDGKPIATSEPSASDGTYKITVPKGVGRVIRGVIGGKAISNGIKKDTIIAYDFNVRWDDKEPVAVKVATREALNGLVSVVQLDGLGVVAGSTNDCDDKEMGGANVVIADPSDKTIGQGPYYFVDAAGSTVPSRNAKYTGEGGVFASFNVPTGTANVTAIGVIGSGAPVTISKATVPVIKDAITIIHMLPSSAVTSLPAAQVKSRIVLEVLAAYALVTGAAAVLYRVHAFDEWFHVLVAALFLYLPAWILRRHDLAQYGLTARPLGRNLLLVVACVLVAYPPFFAGFLLWQKLACATVHLRSLAPTGCEPGALLSHLHLRWPPSLLSLDPRRNLMIAELVVVALPEEFFFRGYVQGRLAEAWPRSWRVLGAPVGPALVVASALFALSHLAVQGNVSTLAVFFPGLLFGWMRARSGSILPGTLFHALCNVYIDTLARSLHG